MRFLKNKKILILSPQAWGEMRISKHHYALELIKNENEVCFVNPPMPDLLKHEFRINEGVGILSYPKPFFHRLKFHWYGLYWLMMSRYFDKVLRSIDFAPEVVLSFDLGGDFSLRHFNKCLKIFFPVDEPRSVISLNASGSADIIFSVSREILNCYDQNKAPKIFINHGVKKMFLADLSALDSELPESDRLRIGYSGNLLRPDIDCAVLFQIVRENADVTFEFWGSYRSAKGNLGKGNGKSDKEELPDFLTMQDNVILHGPVRPEELAKGLKAMDAFLICYDIQKDQSSGTNYHKVLEYLGTGKVIVSNNISTYSKSNLFRMCASRLDNSELPALFRDTITDLKLWNSPSKKVERIRFASDHTYSHQLAKIDDEISNRLFS